MTCRLRRLRTWLSSTWRTLTVSRTQSRAARRGRLKGAPPSLTRTVWYRFQAVSSPMLSYTPPSVRLTFRRYASVLYGGSPVLSSNDPGLHRRMNGERTGGNADDAATAVATWNVGSAIFPNR